MKNSNKIILIIVLVVLNINLNAQVGIGTTSPNGLLDITSASPSTPIATDGLLIPRVSAFPSPVGVAQNGMMVFLTTAFAANKIGIHYYDFPSLTWKRVTTGNNDNIWVNNNINSRIDLPFLSDGTTPRPQGQINILDDGKVGIGTLIPENKFQIGLRNEGFVFGASLQVYLSDFDDAPTRQGIRSIVKRTGGNNYGINATAFGICDRNFALYGYAENATDKNWGLYVERGDAYVQGVVGVGTTTPNSSAILDLSTTTKGLLLPRMTKAQRDAIVKVAGLMIYQTDSIPGLRVCDGTNWVRYTETTD